MDRHMQGPPGPTGPQLSPDGNYWWDGVRWNPTNPYPYAYRYGYQWQPPPPYRFPDPSPGLRTFLLVMLAVADVISLAFAALGAFAMAGYAGFLGPYDGPPPDAFGYGLWIYFEVVSAILLVATIGVVTRSGLWARIVTIVAAVAISVSCLGAVLGIPILISAIRAPMSKPAPAGQV